MLYTSTKICELANVSKKTLRHYDKLGILSPSEVQENGYWFYNQQDLDQLQLIRNLQVLGFTLKEIKLNLDNDCNLLRQSIDSKKQYLDEQILQLNLAKRLLQKIESKENMKVLDAISESMEEEHLEWYQKNLQPAQYKLVEDMFLNPNIMEDHMKLIECFRAFKSVTSLKDQDQLNLVYASIKNIFYKYDLNDETIHFLVKAILQSNLEGPLSQRFLSVKDVVKLLNHL